MLCVDQVLSGKSGKRTKRKIIYSICSWWVSNEKEMKIRKYILTENWKYTFFCVSINNESCIIALHQMVTKGNSNYKRYTCIAVRGIAFTDPLYQSQHHEIKNA